MKYVLFIFLTLLYLLPAKTAAQSEAITGSGFSIGGGLFYGFEAEQAGIRLDGLYRINEDFRAAADFGFYFPENREFDKVNRIEFNINAHYLFVDNDEFNVYGLAGINYFRYSAEFTGTGTLLPGNEIRAFAAELSPVDGGVPPTAHQSGPPFTSPSISNSETGFNLGVGGEYKLNFGLIFGELRYSGIGGADQLVFGAGIRIPI